MAEQTREEMSARRDAAHPDAAHPNAGHTGHNTTPAAWVAVAVIIGAFILGGVALIEWVLWLFYVAVGIAIAGAIAAGASGIMDQVEEYDVGGRGGDPHATLPGALR